MINWTDPNPVFWDCETQSAAELRECGGRLYAQDPTTRVLSAVFLIDGTFHVWIPVYHPTPPPAGEVWPAQLGPAQPVTVHHGGLPDVVRDAVKAGCTFVAHNCFGFDRFIWQYVIARDELVGCPPWADTLLLARASGYPGKLDAIAKATVDIGKDAGHRILMKHVRATVEASGVRYPVVGAGSLAVITRYNIADVELLRRVWQQLETNPVEADVIEAHDAVNCRGVAVDTSLARKIELVAGESVARAAVRISELTGGALGPTNLRSIPQVNAWLASQGVRIHDSNGKTTLRKDFVTQALANPWLMLDEDSPVTAAASINPAVFEVLRLRGAALRITGGKADRAIWRASADARARDLLTYWQAHTGRWSSAGIQVHNLPRPKKGVPVDVLLAAHMSGQWGTDVKAAYDWIASQLPKGLTVDDALSSLLRPLFLAAPGHVLAICDYAAVECRGIAWIAGEESLLQAFRDGADIYKQFGARLFGKPAEAITDAERQIAKVTVLGCVAEGTPVLTDRGWVPIERVEATDRVWDGEAFVTHEGVAFSGVKDVVDVEGVGLTPDHEVLTLNGWVEAWQHRPRDAYGLGTFAENGQLHISPAARAAASRRSGVAAPAVLNTLLTSKTLYVVGQRDATRVPSGSRATRKPYTPTSSLITHTGSGYLTASAQQFSGATTPTVRATSDTAGAGFRFTDPGDKTGGCSWRTLSRSLDGTTQNWRSTESRTTGITNPETFASRLERSRYVTALTTGSAGKQKRYRTRTYDILNAGPRHRYQAGPLIVHNCGYGLGDEKFAIYCALQGVDLAAAGTTAAACVDAFRAAYPAIAGSYAGSIEGRPYRSGGVWSKLARAAMSAVTEGGIHEAGKTRWAYDGSTLRCELPSGRVLHYRCCRVEDRIPGYAKALGIDKAKPTIVYRGAHFETTLYGGKIAENVVQALCRDLLATSLVEAENNGLPIVLHVHDELVAEVPAHAAAESLNALANVMTTVPTWAEGFPIAVEGFCAPRYLKAAPKGWPHVRK